ncbi:SGNH/GDSL hydrolase family protein [Rugamonas rubra]|uniref:Uncharacterized protein n=1 Tax=Rugamonas rubra TaxID=758825 RepID=A0A1I4TQF5_9BURK|nr:SGNH/GDSL hydrolase family protein [Rugamonas rubra]SFM78992.1 hypothetical protein SAMN02982985_05300 [Rugamonas rubra]
MHFKSRRNFLKSIGAASVVSTLGEAAFMSHAYANSFAGASAASQGGLPADARPTLGIVGDQVTSKFYYVSPSKLTVAYQANGYLTWALALSGQRLRIVFDDTIDRDKPDKPVNSIFATPGATVSGDFLKQVQACIDMGVSDIICMGGQNDLVGGTSLARLQEAWTAAIQLAVSNNKRVWWLTQTPLDKEKLAVRADIIKLNQWILAQGTAYSGVHIIDVASRVCGSVAGAGAPGDPSAWCKGYSKDGATPINVGAYYMGKAIAEVWRQELPNDFSLAHDPLDDIQGDPRSCNIVHNSLFTETGITGFNMADPGVGYTKNFELVFTDGIGSGAVGVAEVKDGKVVSLIVENSGVYSVAPKVSFEKGDGHGAVAEATLGIAGFVGFAERDAKTTVTSIAPLGDGANEAAVTVNYPAWQAIGGLAYGYTMTSAMANHIGPQDKFSIRCVVTRNEALPTTDRLAAIGPVVKCFLGQDMPEYSFVSCRYSADDSRLPEGFTAVFLTPPAKSGLVSNITLYLQAANDNTNTRDTTASFKLSRFSCIVEPSKQFAAVEKSQVKFNPGHYCTVYPNWEPFRFITEQDSFNQDVRNGSNGLLETTAAWRGIELPCYWRELEPNEGEYQYKKIEDWLEALGEYVNKNGVNVKKHLIVYLLSDSYNRQAKDSFPDYILAEGYADGGKYGGVYPHNFSGSTPRGFKARYFHPKIQERLIALGKALAAKFDDHELFEAFRMDETSPGETFAHDFPKERTNYVEGQINIAHQINKAFKKTMFIMGFNYVADQKFSRAARMFIQAGVGMGGVDLVMSDRALAGRYQSYDIIKAASPYVPSVIHFDGGNYMSNANTPQDITKLVDYAKDRLHASHICWNRKYDHNTPNAICDYRHLTSYLNTLHTQEEWESAAGRTGGLITERPSSIA